MEVDIYAARTVMHGVGIMILRRAGRKATYAVWSENRAAQHADEMLVAHIQHAFVIRGRQGQQWYILGAHARTIHSVEIFVKGFLCPGARCRATQAQLPAGSVNIMALFVTHGNRYFFCYQRAAEGLALSLRRAYPG